MSDNPYAAPVSTSASSCGQRWWSAFKVLGTICLAVGLLQLVYGALACFVIRNLPPNNAVSGRLPSIYIMGLGGILSVIGLAMRDLRIGPQSGAGSKGVSSRIGFVILVAMVIGMFVWIARL